MLTGRAFLQRISAFMYITTLPALPFHLSILFENFSLFKVLQNGAVSLLMSFFSIGNHPEKDSDFLEALVLCDFRK